jgi:uncharacterized protein (TIGR00296 family)
MSDFAYTEQEGQFLVTLARKTLSTYLQSHKKLPVPEDTPPKLREKSGVFVTLNIYNQRRKDFQLRGCIGRPYPDQPLVQATIDSAIDAGTGDPRFNRVSQAELEQIQFEVTALTPPELIPAKTEQELFDAIEIGVHGLLLKVGYGGGLFLPQVPVDWKWDKEQYLDELCGKAGVSSRTWHDLDRVKIYRFRGEIFQEEVPNGKIVRHLLMPSP